MKRQLFSQRKKFKAGKFRKGIYILPNFFTTCSLFCAFYSIISSFNGHFIKAAWAILFSAVFDWLDGKIARASRTISQFGIEYDSLSDLIAFGLAPGLLIYTWGLVPFGRAGWLATFLYVACTALRLARFNVNVTNLETRYFQGLPSPAAGGMIATTVIIAHRLGWLDNSKHILVLVLTLFLSFLMVSKVRYFSLKKLEVSGTIPFQISVILLCLIVIVAAEPHFTLFTIFSLYTISGPILFVEKKLVLLRKKRIEGKEENLPVST